jgi:hypothetical protein
MTTLLEALRDGAWLPMAVVILAIVGSLIWVGRE